MTTITFPNARPFRSALLAAALCGGFAQASTVNGFQGPLAPAQFSIGNQGTLLGIPTQLGSATFTPTTLTLVGSDTNAGGGAVGCANAVYAAAGDCGLFAIINGAGTIAFDFDYSTQDGDGPAGDIFGVLVDGILIALSDPGGALSQSGSRSFAFDNSFGWTMNCTDCLGGFASVTVGNVSLDQRLPLPGSLALAVAALAALGGVRRWSA